MCFIPLRCETEEQFPPSGDRWLRFANLRCLLLNRSHPLPSGGQRRERGFHRLATGGYVLRTCVVCCGIVANLPFSYRWEPSESMGDDVRFKSHGIAPKSAADFAFLLHGFHFLKD